MYLYSEVRFSQEAVRQAVQAILNSGRDKDVIDLLLLEDIQRKAFGLFFEDYAAVDLIKRVLCGFNDAIRRITVDRYTARSGLSVQDEYDVQDILFSILKGYFHDLERENPIPKLAGKSSRVDLTIMSQGIIIEVKMIKSTDKSHQKYIQELKQDMVDYSAWKGLQNLVFFTFDPFSITSDTNHFRELEGYKELNGVSFFVHSVLVK